MRSNYLFTSESVSEGHPDKVADQISDALVDYFISHDPESRVACETLVTTQRIVIGGEIRCKGAFDEVREAARSIRTLADNLDKRTAAIASGLTRFTNSGLREYEALATEGRRAVNDVGRTVRSLEKNPQQLIFGGKPNLPEYNGRR